MNFNVKETFLKNFEEKYEDFRIQCVIKTLAGGWVAGGGGLSLMTL